MTDVVKTEKAEVQTFIHLAAGNQGNFTFRCKFSLIGPENKLFTVQNIVQWGSSVNLTYFLQYFLGFVSEFSEACHVTPC